MFSRRTFLLLVGSLSVSCTLDQRELNGIDGVCGTTGECCQGEGACASGGRAGSAGSSSHSGGSAQGGSAQRSGGRGGAEAGSPDPGDAGDPGVGPSADCPDLDLNTVPDCIETLAKNPNFDGDTKYWSPEANGAVSWDALDSQGSSRSGTLRVENRSTAVAGDGGLVYSGATQCVPIRANRAYDLLAQMYSRGPTITGYGSVVGRVFASDDCSGSPVSVKTSPIQATVDAWITLSTQVPATEGAGSLLVELSVGRPSSAAGPVFLNFDNVLLR